MSRFFITATDTDAGKTLVSCALLRCLALKGYSTLGLKPVASGCSMTSGGLRNQDALQLMEAATEKLDYEQVNPYAFAPAIAPHIAARQSGVTIGIASLTKHIQQFSHHADVVLVEGVGGWLVPLNQKETIADFAQSLGYRVILVVGMKLGCINHALLTVNAIVRQGLTLHGWVANSAVPEMENLADNITAIGRRIDAPLLAVIPYLPDSGQDCCDAIDARLFL